MIRHTLNEIKACARDGEAICLHCGAVQEIPGVLTTHMLCENCDRWEMLAATDVLRALDLLEDEE